ncbi:hypothetical protein Tco_0696704 [Tanacetum coccineum]
MATSGYINDLNAVKDNITLRVRILYKQKVVCGVVAAIEKARLYLGKGGEIVKGYTDHVCLKDLASLMLEAQKFESKTVSVENSVGYGIVNACVNLRLLEKAVGYGVLD